MIERLWTPQQIIIAPLLFALLLVAMFILTVGFKPAQAVAPGGLALYQGRHEHPGIAVRLYNQNTPLTTTDSSGHFNLQGLDDGTYWLSLEAPLYLPDLIEVVVTDGAVTTAATSASPVVLSGGDLNRDDTIDISDVTLLGASFGLPNPQADINADGKVNLFDLTIIGGNFGRTVPAPPVEEDTSSQEEDIPVEDNSKSQKIFLPLVVR